MLITRLDHWLSANASFAVGSINGTTPAFDPTGASYLPLSMTSFDPSFSTANNQPNMGLNQTMPTFAGTPWSDMTSAPIPTVPANTGGGEWGMPASNAPTPIQGSFGTSGLDGGGLGTGMIGVAEGVGQENSDEYWNALIDGVF